MDRHYDLLELERTLGSRVVRRFLGAPWSRGRNVRNVVGLTLQLENPHRNRRIREMGFVEVERHLIGDGRNLVFGFHGEVERHRQCLRLRQCKQKK